MPVHLWRLFPSTSLTDDIEIGRIKLVVLLINRKDYEPILYISIINSLKYTG